MRLPQGKPRLIALAISGVVLVLLCLLVIGSVLGNIQRG
jgi:hypothetical protein